MAKKNRGAARAPTTQSAPAAPAASQPAAAPAPAGGGTDGPPPAAPETRPAEAVPAAAGPTVDALVLFDSVYGKCGEVRAFDASTADAIAAAGFIDTHPNAVASARS